MRLLRRHLALAAVALAVVAPPLAAQETAGAPSNLALEVELAATPQVYLVVDTGASALEVRSRGRVLDRVALAGIAVVRERELVGGPEPPVLELPALWRVVNRSGRANREIVAPPSLEPYSEEKAGQTARKPTTAQPPDVYEVRCDSGWSVAVAPELPAGGFFARWRQAIGSAWSKLWGVEILARPTVALAMPAADAERLHHLFRVKTAILVR